VFTRRRRFLVMFVDFFADVGVSYTLQVGTSRASFIFYKLHFYF
jgi:hypothetical protein